MARRALGIGEARRCSRRVVRGARDELVEAERLRLGGGGALCDEDRVGVMRRERRARYGRHGRAIHFAWILSAAQKKYLFEHPDLQAAWRAAVEHRRKSSVALFILSGAEKKGEAGSPPTARAQQELPALR